jgi:hypothetical protein
VNWNGATKPDGSTNWNDQARRIRSREDLVALLQTLVRELREDPEGWENRDLAAYLSAMAAWVDDMEGFYKNRGEPMPDQPSWNTLGQILLAARVYE